MSINIFGGNGDEIDQNLDLNGFIIYNSGEPENPADLATKFYVDSKLSGGTNWTIEGNDLLTNGRMGSTTDYDVTLIRNNLNKIILGSNGTFITDRCLVIDDSPIPATVLLGCNNLRVNNRFILYLGNSGNNIMWTNIGSSPISLISQYGFNITSNNENIAEFNASNINFNNNVNIAGNLNFINDASNVSSKLINCILTNGNSFEITSGNAYMTFNKTSTGTNLSIGGYTVFISNLLNPISSDQAANKGYVDSKHDLQVSKAGDTMTGDLTFTNYSTTDNIRFLSCDLIDNNSFTIRSDNAYITFHKTPDGTILLIGAHTVTINNLELPVSGDQAANKAYVDYKHDLQLSKAGGIMTGDLTFDGSASRGIRCNLENVGSFFGLLVDSFNFFTFEKTATGINFRMQATEVNIGNVRYPTGDKDAASKEYVDDQIDSLSSTYVAKAGSTMTGDLNLSIGTDAIRNIGCSNLTEGKLFQILLGDGNNILAHEGAAVGTYNPVIFDGTGLLVNFKGNNLMRFGTSDSDMRILTYTTLKLGGAIDANVNNIYNLADPVGVNDAATKQYVDTRKCLIGYIPNLSTNISKTGFTASASSEFSSSYAAWYTFNITSEYSWATAGIYNNFWIKIQCPDSVTVWGFALRGRGTTIERIYNWRLEGSNDNNTFTTLYTGNNDYLGPTTKFYDISSSNNNSYRYYRLYAVNAESNNPGLSYMQIYVYNK